MLEMKTRTDNVFFWHRYYQIMERIGQITQDLIIEKNAFYFEMLLFQE